MHVVTLKPQTLRGISTRTTNQNEMSPETAKIGKLWQQFNALVDIDYQQGERVHAVYYDYESDATGEFNVLAGFDGTASPSQGELESITIEAGQYLLFSATAEVDTDEARIQAVIGLWGEVWAYFSGNPEYQRAYTTDIEKYKNQTEIEIYISISE